MIKVGQKIWFVEHVFNRNRGLLEGTVTKVGTKYITVKGRIPSLEFRFCKKSFIQDTSNGSAGCLYLTEQDYMDEIELSSNIELIRDRFPIWGCEVTLEQTRKILKVLEGTE